MSKQAITAVATMALTLAACSPGIDVHTEVAPEARQDQPQTVSVVGAAEYLGRTPADYSPLLNNATTVRALRTDLAHGLARRGYVVSDAAPQALLVYYLAVPEENDVTDAGYEYVWRPAWWRGWEPGAADASPAEYADGALMIDLVDARTGQVFWREHAVAPLESHERAYEKALGRSVAALLDHLPPPPHANG